MIYQVRKSGKIYMKTECENCRYPPNIEGEMQTAGYDIYIDGKKQKRAKQNARSKTVKKGGNICD